MKELKTLEEKVFAETKGNHEGTLIAPSNVKTTIVSGPASSGAPSVPIASTKKPGENWLQVTACAC